MNIIVPEEIIDFINTHKKFIIAGHKDPDGDCLGSQMALDSFLSRLGKETILFSPGPFQRLEVSPFQSFFKTSLNGVIDKGDYIAIVLDCSVPERLGPGLAEIEDLDIIYIDHHKTKGTYGKFSFVEPKAPAVTYLIQLLIEQMGHTPTPEEARYLFLGLCTDTGYFRHLEEDSGSVFKAAGRLIDAGANPKETYFDIFGGNDIQERMLIARIIKRTESHLYGKVRLTWYTKRDKKEVYSGSLKIDEVYRLLQLTRDTEIVVVIKQEEKIYSVSFRSKGRYKVDHIASHFGGGGHALAAGCEFKGPLQKIKEQILTYLEEELTE